MIDARGLGFVDAAGAAPLRLLVERLSRGADAVEVIGASDLVSVVFDVAGIAPLGVLPSRLLAARDGHRGPEAELAAP